MFVPEENVEEFGRFPEVLRRLVEEEVGAGNRVVEFGHGFPAAPCGAYIKLASPVRTRDRVACAELDFHDRDSDEYSGEFTDAKRHFFVLEPPHEPKPEPDMRAIRAAIDAEYAANDAIQYRGSNQPAPDASRADIPEQDRQFDRPSARADDSPLVQRFVQSMEMNYDKWKEGEGYDLSLVDEANDSERACIEKILVGRSQPGWRDIEALAKIDSPTARAAVLASFLNGDTETRMAVHSYAPELVTETLRTDSIVRGLRESTLYYGLSETLDEIADFHPPAVVEELLRGLVKRDGGTACHFAAMLYFLYGKASSAFDWDHRPFFLRFNTDDMGEREKAVRELCEVIGVDPADCL